MAGDLVERLELAAKIHDDMTGKGNAMAATIREAASALRSSEEVVAWEAGDGRVISARQKSNALRDGGASASSVAPYSRPLFTHPATPASAWRPIAEAALLPRGLDGVSGPCAVLLRIDTGRPGPFIRQGRFDAAAGAFVCDSVGQVLIDAVAFAKPEWPTPPASTSQTAAEQAALERV